jgi:hypothetical protein
MAYLKEAELIRCISGADYDRLHIANIDVSACDCEGYGKKPSA